MGWFKDLYDGLEGAVQDVGHGIEDAWQDLTEPVTGNQATKKAIEAQTNAANQANQTQRDIYDQQRQDQMPWYSAGIDALGNLTGNLDDYSKTFSMADFQQDPGYQFRLNEGLKALNASAAGRGSRLGGGQMKALTRYGQDYASGEYNNAYNRFNADRDQRWNKLAGLAGVGQSATGQMGQATQNYGNQVSSNQMGVGNAIASAEIASANRMSNLMGQVVQAYGASGKPGAPGSSRGSSSGNSWLGDAWDSTKNLFSSNGWGGYSTPGNSFSAQGRR